MKRFITIVCMTFLGLISFGQTLSLDWFDKFEFDKKEGFLKEIAGETKSSIYLRYFDYDVNIANANGEKKNPKTQIAIYDKATKKLIKTQKLQGYGNDEFKNLDYYKTCILGNTVYTFWRTKREALAKNSDLYVKTYDTLFTPKSNLKKIISIKASDLIELQRYVHVCKNNNLDKLFLVVELGRTEVSVGLETYILSSDLNISKPLKIELPYKVLGNEVEAHDPMAIISLTNSGVLIGTCLNTNFVINENNTIKKILDTNVDGKIINSLRYFENNSGIQFFGTYITKYTNDLKLKKPGLVKFKLDAKSLSLSKYEYLTFNDEQINVLFPPYKDKKSSFYTVGWDKIEKNYFDYELDEIVQIGNELCLMLTKSNFLVELNKEKVQITPRSIVKLNVVPIRFTENNTINLLQPIEKNLWSRSADFKTIESYTEGDYVFSIMNEEAALGKDDPAGNIFNSRFYYTITNIKTGITESKYFQLYNHKDKKSTVKTFAYFPLSFISEYQKTIYYFFNPEIDFDITSKSSPKFIGQLSITK